MMHILFSQQRLLRQLLQKRGSSLILIFLVTSIFNITSHLPRPVCDFYLTPTLPCRVHYKAIFPSQWWPHRQARSTGRPSVLPGNGERMAGASSGSVFVKTCDKITSALCSQQRSRKNKLESKAHTVSHPASISSVPSSPTSSPWDSA